MRSNRRRAMWSATAPVADSVLRESAFRVSARHPRMWGSVLARLRAAGGLSPMEQADALGITASALAFLSVWRLPRPGRIDEDLVEASVAAGVGVEVLRELLRAGAEYEAGAALTLGGVA
jgi:hypothetical protein